MFKDAKVGDAVFSSADGCGKIIVINKGRTYPVGVEFCSSVGREDFVRDGRYTTNDRYPTLFPSYEAFKEYFAKIDPPERQGEKDKVCFVCKEDMPELFKYDAILVCVDCHPRYQGQKPSRKPKPGEGWCDTCDTHHIQEKCPSITIIIKSEPEEKCGNCRFGVEEKCGNSFHPNETRLRCHRYPPVIIDNEVRFPIIKNYWWCGDWDAKVKS